MRTNSWFLVLGFLLALPASSAAQVHKRATPPTTDELVGAWIGFDLSGSEFIRLELHSDGSGCFAVVAPANFITHDYGVQVYSVRKWSVNGWHIALDPSPSSSNAEPAQATAEFVVSSLRLEIRGLNRRWKIESALYMESRLDGSNKATKDAILAVRRR